MDSRLAEFRRKQHLTLSQMAEKTKTTQTLYNKIEYCERKPSYDFQYRFRKAFPGVDLGEIFFDTEDYIL